jgi:hypothetical protein
MEAKLQNLFGWILLLAGLIMISWIIYSSFNIFTAKTAAPEIFKVKTENQGQAVKGKTPTTQAELQKQMENLIGEQLKTILPLDTLPKLLNLICWSVFATFLVFAGTHVSGLGIKMLKK